MEKILENICLSDQVYSCSYFDITNEDWDTNNAGSSWYREASLPSDCFYSSADSSLWKNYNYKGEVNVDINKGLYLEINKQEACGGLTSQDIWQISDDFLVSCVIDASGFSNRLRSSCSVGFVLSMDSEHKVRLVLNYDGETQKIRSYYVDGIDLKYIGWSKLAEASVQTISDTVVLYIKKEQDSITFSASINGVDYSIGTLTKAGWDKPFTVQLELETEQMNTCSGLIKGFYVEDGDITFLNSQEYYPNEKGPEGSFPNRFMLVVDSFSISIVDYLTSSLWMRCYVGSELPVGFPNTVSFSNGSLYCATSNGVEVLDFKDDKYYCINNDGIFRSNMSLLYRNSYIYKEGFNNNITLPDNSITSLDSIYSSGNSYLAVATTSGVIVSESLGPFKASYSPYPKINKVKFSENGNLYWSSEASNSGESKIAITEGLVNSWESVPNTFDFSRLYDTASHPFILSSHTFNDFDVSGSVLAVGGHYGVDVINYPHYRRSYGRSVGEGDTLPEQLSFNTYPGDLWSSVYNSVVPRVFVVKTSEWEDYINDSYKFYVGDYFTDQGIYGGVFTDLDFTSISSVIFDYKFVLGSLYSATLTEYLEILIDGDIVFQSNDPDLNVLQGDPDLYHFGSGEPFDSYTHYNCVIDTKAITGLKTITVRLRTIEETVDVFSPLYAYATGKKYYISGFRLETVAADFDITTWKDSSISTNINVLKIMPQGDTHKIAWLNNEGLGIIDLDTNSLEYFEVSEQIENDLLFNNIEVF